MADSISSLSGGGRSACSLSLSSGGGHCELEIQSELASDAGSDGPPGLIRSRSASLQGDDDDEGVELEVLSALDDDLDVLDCDHVNVYADVLSLQAVVAKIQAADNPVNSDRPECAAVAAAEAPVISDRPEGAAAAVGTASPLLPSPSKKRKTSSSPASQKESGYKYVAGCGVNGEPFPDGTAWWAQHVMDALSYWIARRDVSNVSLFMLESLCAGTGAEVTAMKACIRSSVLFLFLALASLLWLL
jgi:hypothetical protein